MSWPPKNGEMLPRAVEATGVREKLAGYSLDPENEAGAPKARGFALILGIGREHIDHLEAELRTGILSAPVSSVRANAPHGYNCVVDVRVRGVGEKRARTVNVPHGVGAHRARRATAARLRLSETLESGDYGNRQAANRRA